MRGGHFLSGEMGSVLLWSEGLSSSLIRVGQLVRGVSSSLIRVGQFLSGERGSVFHS